MQPVTRGFLKGEILRLFLKTSAKKGFLTDARLNSAIQEAQDYISTKFFIAGQGWSKKIKYYTTVANQISIDLDISAAMITNVRYLYDTVYTPMAYDDAWDAQQYNENSGVVQWNYSYRIVDNALYFNPPMAVGGTDYLQVEYMAYAKTAINDGDNLDPVFDSAMQHFIKYKAASVCASALEMYNVPWAGQENDWYTQITKIIERRNLQSIPIQDYMGQ